MTPEEFPAWFTDVWARPKPDGFVDAVMPLVAEDAVFTQPGYGVARGRAEVESVFRRLFTLIPDLVALPRHTAVNGQIVFIESHCTGTLGARPFSFDVTDRFTLRDGLIAERRSYTDPTTTIRAVLSRPRSWGAAARAR